MGMGYFFSFLKLWAHYGLIPKASQVKENGGLIHERWHCCVLTQYLTHSETNFQAALKTLLFHKINFCLLVLNFGSPVKHWLPPKSLLIPNKDVIAKGGSGGRAGS